MLSSAIWIIGCGLVLFIYLRHASHGILNIPSEAVDLVYKPCTKADYKKVYDRISKSPPDVKPFLKPATGRRYIVVGGTGLVGGWIVQHLLMRGEDPKCIRILDLQPTTRTDWLEKGVAFVKTDISDPNLVDDAFNKSWPSDSITKKPLTVFHCVAYIGFKERKADFMGPYQKVNIMGTKHLLEAAKQAGASCFVLTGSGSTCVKPGSFFPWPWQSTAPVTWQLFTKSRLANRNSSLKDFVSCYAYSKAQAERMVCDADDRAANFRTGCMRPCYAIYGQTADNPSGLNYQYFPRDQIPTWIATVGSNIVHAQNVSIAHLAYEAKLIADDATSVDKIAARAYFCTDTGKAVTYRHIYEAINALAHPYDRSVIKLLPPIPMLIIAHIIELWDIIAQRTKLISRPQGDLSILQPATFGVCSLHTYFDDSEAKQDLDYQGAFTSIEGLCWGLLDWNNAVEGKKSGAMSKLPFTTADLSSGGLDAPRVR